MIISSRKTNRNSLGQKNSAENIYLRKAESTIFVQARLSLPWFYYLLVYYNFSGSVMKGLQYQRLQHQSFQPDQ